MVIVVGICSSRPDFLSLACTEIHKIYDSLLTALAKAQSVD